MRSKILRAGVHLAAVADDLHPASPFERVQFERVQLQGRTAPGGCQAKIECVQKYFGPAFTLRRSRTIYIPHLLLNAFSLYVFNYKVGRLRADVKRTLNAFKNTSGRRSPCGGRGRSTSRISF